MTEPDRQTEPGPMTGAGALAESASQEWLGLVTAAILGTDRRPPPPPAPGWDSWGPTPRSAAGQNDHAVAVLDRALAVVLARRAGATPGPSPPSMQPAPIDHRPPCPAPCAARLARLLAGDHEVLLPEWLRLCADAGVQLPAHALPTLLLRGRRQPELDVAVRRLAGGRAEWLACVVPELGVPVTAAALPMSKAPSAPVARTDGGAAVTAVTQLFAEGLASWAAAPQLRLVVVGLDPAWLPALVVELSRLPFRAPAERTRAEVLGLAEFRSAMLREFDQARTVVGPRSGGAPCPPDPDDPNEPI